MLFDDRLKEANKNHLENKMEGLILACKTTIDYPLQRMIDAEIGMYKLLYVIVVRERYRRT